MAKRKSTELAERVQAVMDALDLSRENDDFGRRSQLNYARLAEAKHLGLALFADLFGPTHHVTTAFHDALTDGYAVDEATGIAVAAKRMVVEDWLSKTRAKISGEVFTDFLAMAEQLHEDGYKDAAAVIAGSALEAHLRRLADNSPDVGSTFVDKSGEARPKGAERLNTDLYKAGVYNVTDQKHVIAWQAIRHDAAHGRYERVVKEQVGAMIDGIRFFIRTYPA